MIALLAIIIGITTPVYPGESIQNALDTSASGDTVLVMSGTYYGEETNHLITITDEHNGIVLLGNNTDPWSVVLSGDSLSDSIIYIDCATGETIDTTMVISGFSFINGNASISAFGGAVHTRHSSPLIEYSRFAQCSADNGGAIYSWKGSPVIRYCSFQNNQCESAGGAVYLYSSAASISYSTFTDNVSWDDGGGIYCYHCSPTIFDCLFAGGYAHDDGGGIYCYALSDPEISFCTFNDNYAMYTGSAVYFRVNSSPVLHHNIVTENEGPAFYIQDGGEPVFLYNDVWGNPDGNYGNLEDQTGTAGNISADPLFANGFYLSQTASGQTADSPCVDAGGNQSSAYGLEAFWTRTDSVPDSGVVDMGYHYGFDTPWQSNPQEPDTGSLRIYPNPTLGSITVKLPGNGSYNLLEIFDFAGRRIYTNSITGTGRSTKADLTDQAASGIYLVRVSGESGSLTGRLTLLNR